MPKLLHMLKVKDVLLSEVRCLLVTHYHPDHAGLAQELKQRGVRLIVMEGQARFIPMLGRYMKPDQHYVEIDLSDNIDLRLSESRAFLSKMGIQGEIITTPGHSDDSVTLVADEGAAFTGDLPPEEAVTGEAAEQVRESWRRIRSLGAKTSYPGHGGRRELR